VAGNVRELKNVIERAIILSTGKTLRIDRLGAEGEVPMQSMALKQVEKEHILNVLESTGWRVRGQNGAAFILDLKPTTLEARMKKLGIRRTT
jgi:transcriptional regulator with GAF, ATPase, and Fis domain